jgi:cytochrome c551/c552
MKKLVIIFLALALTACNDKNKTKVIKYASSDPFAESVTPSQFLTFSTEDDAVLEGADGTLLVVPKGSILDENGDAYIGDVSLELTEALHLADMVLSNLTTTSDGKLLETGGMLYVNFTTSEGKQLFINKDKPIYIEIPTEKKKGGMMVYKGERDAEGNMNWTDPQELAKFLVTVDMDQLDFLPEGFAERVTKGLPFRGHTTSTQTLIDSLYYSLKISSAQDLIRDLNSTNYNEPYLSRNSSVFEGEYTENSYDYALEVADSAYNLLDTTTICGINPASIKIVRSEEYAQTYIATRAFEARVKALHKACRNEILELYITNLDKNLWEVDRMARDALADTRYEAMFENFYKQKLTKVENSQHARLLGDYYKRRLAAVEGKLKKLREEVSIGLQEKNKAFKSKADKYKKLLFKREKHRMESYGFSWSSNGWLNVDKGTSPKDRGWKPLEVKIQNQFAFDQIYTYIFFNSIKSLYRLNTNDGKTFYVGNDKNREMIMPKKGAVTLISVAYRQDTAYLGYKDGLSPVVEKAQLQLGKTTHETIANRIASYDKYSKENRISVDLEYMAIFHKEKQRQNKLRNEAIFIQSLVDKAYGCCADIEDGGKLFAMHCTPCHQLFKKAIGPALRESSAKHPSTWLLEFTKNNAALRAKGDQAAIDIFEEYNGSIMPSFEHLSDRQIMAIYNYVDAYNTHEDQ